MVQLVHIETVCDLCHAEDGRKTEPVGKRRVAFDGGKALEVDLCADHAQMHDDYRHLIERTARQVKQGRPRKVRPDEMVGDHVCDECGRAYGTQQALSAHSRSHKAEDVECPVCHKIFKGSRALAVHGITHEDRRVTCAECGREFASRQGLSSHQRTVGHTGEGDAQQPELSAM